MDVERRLVLVGGDMLWEGATFVFSLNVTVLSFRIIAAENGSLAEVVVVDIPFP